MVFLVQGGLSNLGRGENVVADLPEEVYESFNNVDSNLEETAEKTTEETICQARMNRRDDDIELEDNDDEEELEEKPPSAQGIL
ncbi:hypothetical protein AVEN_173260-1 [Araneus ventricosus]|uniref:Uncharacterized protein n=1 Tax=Araneus ventricosus TaxID=182803 RepID=A0A4Y2HFP6_ARAVE|nr:hypothetical protein AVEN_173260-1 [Araneus ventricosus]